jgi:hypothetical protein
MAVHGAAMYIHVAGEEMNHGDDSLSLSVFYYVYVCMYVSWHVLAGHVAGQWMHEFLGHVKTVCVFLLHMCMHLCMCLCM